MSEVLIETVVVKIGEESYGVWCPDCLLPSAAEIPIELETRGGSPLGTPGHLTICLDGCHWIDDGSSIDPAVLGFSASPCDYFESEDDDAGHP